MPAYSSQVSSVGRLFQLNGWGPNSEDGCFESSSIVVVRSSLHVPLYAATIMSWLPLLLVKQATATLLVGVFDWMDACVLATSAQGENTSSELGRKSIEPGSENEPTKGNG